MASERVKFAVLNAVDDLRFALPRVNTPRDRVAVEGALLLLSTILDEDNEGRPHGLEE